MNGPGIVLLSMGISLAIGAVLNFVVARTCRRRHEQRADTIFEMRYPRTYQFFGFVGFAMGTFPTICAIDMSARGESPGAPLAVAIMMFMAGGCLSLVQKRVSICPGGFSFCSLWRQYTFVPWSEVIDVDYSPSRAAFVLHTRQEGFHIGTDLGNLPELLDVLSNHFPDQLWGKARQQQGLGASGDTRKGDRSFKQLVGMGLGFLGLLFWLCLSLLGLLFLTKGDHPTHAIMGVLSIFCCVCGVVETLRYLRRVSQRPGAQLTKQHFPQPRSGMIRLCDVDVLRVSHRWGWGIFNLLCGALIAPGLIDRVNDGEGDLTIGAVVGLLFLVFCLLFNARQAIYLHNLTIDLVTRRYSLRRGCWPTPVVVEGPVDDLAFGVSRRMTHQTAFGASLCVFPRDQSWDAFEIHRRPNEEDRVPSINLDHRTDFLPIVHDYAKEATTLLGLPKSAVILDEVDNPSEQSVDELSGHSSTVGAESSRDRHPA